MKAPFLELAWHQECVNLVRTTHRRSGIAVVRGRPLSGKRRFFANLPLNQAIVAEQGNIYVFNCPACGTDREILVRLARKLGVEECKTGDVRSELLIIEKIAEALGSQSTIVINDAERMSASLLQAVLGIRDMVEDSGGTVALILGTTYSANHFLAFGLPEEEVSRVYEIPDLNPGEILGCLAEMCPDQISISADATAVDPEIWALGEDLRNRNLGRVGLLVEFAAIVADEHSGASIREVGLTIARKMGNECRIMERLPQRPLTSQSEMFDDL